MEERQRRRLLAYYEVSAAIMWSALLIGVAVILQGTPYFGQLLPILGAGAAVFVVILPASLSQIR
jgi:hypothetical protein